MERTLVSFMGLMMAPATVWTVGRVSLRKDSAVVHSRPETRTGCQPSQREEAPGIILLSAAHLRTNGCAYGTLKLLRLVEGMREVLHGVLQQSLVSADGAQLKERRKKREKGERV